MACPYNWCLHGDQHLPDLERDRGTPMGMAPEHANGVKPLTEAVDVHALDATCFFALTGLPLLAHEAQARPSLPEVVKQFRAIIEANGLSIAQVRRQLTAHMAAPLQDAALPAPAPTRGLAGRVWGAAWETHLGNHSRGEGALWSWHRPTGHLTAQSSSGLEPSGEPNERGPGIRTKGQRRPRCDLGVTNMNRAGSDGHLDALTPVSSAVTALEPDQALVILPSHVLAPPVSADSQPWPTTLRE